jgi:hypothetical protein
MATNRLKLRGGKRSNTVRPVRLQLSRAAGFNLQALSRDTNGLSAVNVARPGKWGNPYTVDNSGTLHPAEMYARKVAPTLNTAPLRGKNLACWCKLGSQCHADILLTLANAD